MLKLICGELFKINKDSFSLNLLRKLHLMSNCAPGSSFKAIGIIGMGAMGKMCAKRFYEAGWTSLNVCDVPENYEKLKSEFPHYNVHCDGHLVSQTSDYILFCVNSALISELVKKYAPSMKHGATVGGQTSTKSLEIKAFEAFCSQEINIVTCHSFHGPDVDPSKYPLVIIRHRSSDLAFENTYELLKCLHPTPILMSTFEHERVTAHVQILLHTCLLARTCSQMQTNINPFSIEADPFALPQLRMLKQPWYIYGGMAMSHSFAADVFSKFLDFLSSEDLNRNKSCNQKPAPHASSTLVSSSLPECFYALVQIAPSAASGCQTPLYRYIDSLVHQHMVSKWPKNELIRDPNFINSFQNWTDVILNKDSQKYQTMFEKIQALAQPYMQTAEAIWQKRMKDIESNRILNQEFDEREE